MKRRILFTLFAMMIVLNSCTPVPGGDPLVWLTFPVMLEGTLIYNGKTTEASFEFDSPDHGRHTTDGTEYLIDGGTAMLGVKGFMLPIAVTPPSVIFVRELLSLDASRLSGTSSDGVYVTSRYASDNGEYTIVTDKDGRLVSASAQLSEGTFEFIADIVPK